MPQQEVHVVCILQASMQLKAIRLWVVLSVDQRGPAHVHGRNAETLKRNGTEQHDQSKPSLQGDQCGQTAAEVTVPTQTQPEGRRGLLTWHGRERWIWCWWLLRVRHGRGRSFAGAGRL